MVEFPTASAHAPRAHLRSEHSDLIVHVLVRRIAVEMGPLVAFFVVYNLWDIFVATLAFMAATALAVAASLAAERRIPILPLLSLALVLGFGALTLLTDDPRFIMVRPTVVNLFYAVALLGSLFIGRPALEAFLSPGLRLDAAGWRLLTLNLGLFLLLQAALNEIVWRGFDVHTWVLFKTFGTLPLNVVFAATQIPLVKAHRLGGRAPDRDAA